MNRRARFVGSSAIDLTKYDIQRPDDCRYVGQHVTAAEEIHGREMGKRWRPDLAFVWPVGAVGDEIDSELALRRLDRRIDFATRHTMALAVQFEMLDRGLHGALHFGAQRRHDLSVLDCDGATAGR